MSARSGIPRLSTGVRHLDPLLGGGLPRGSVIVVAGPPGSGKTILTQQIGFHNASATERVLYFSTLSEPTTKTLRYLQQFSFFDRKKLGTSIHFVDLGVMLRTKGLPQTAELIMRHVKKVKPSIVVIDSFKVFDDLARSGEELRKFGYELAVNLMAWETTAFLLGEYGAADYETNPLFSIVDGLVVLSQREVLGEHQRLLEIVKMRGTDHSRDEHAFRITGEGHELLAPKIALRREPSVDGQVARCKTGIAKLDELLGPGIPRGSSLLVSGVAGTGKTVLSLEFLYRGALAGEKGILFSFEETEDRLRATARGLGWSLDEQLERGMLEIVFIPQPEIMVEAHLLMMAERVARLGARRVVVDSVSVFLHKVTDPQVAREKVFHLCTLVQNAQAVGFLATDVPYGSTQISRFGVEETVVDGVVLLTSSEEGLERQRYVEIYKLRNTAHLEGRHSMAIGAEGLAIFPRYSRDASLDGPPPALDSTERLGTGVPGLDALLGGGLLRRSLTLVSGSPGIGKSTMAMQLLLEGARHGERGLYVTLEEGAAQLASSAAALDLPFQEAIADGRIEVLYVSREHLRVGQFLSALTDRLEALGARRMVLDAATHMLREGKTVEELRHVLYQLAVRFKSLGVTSLFTLESPSLWARDVVTEQNLSPVADNLLMLRYVERGTVRVPTLSVVKTRGSAHDAGTHDLAIGPGGLRLASARGARKRPAGRTKGRGR